MSLNVVEQPNAVSFEREDDTLKPRYLASLDTIDRSNLAKIVNALKTNLPSGSRILAVGSSTMNMLDRSIHYRDMDLKVFSDHEFIPILGQLVYSIVSRLDGFKVEKYLKGEFLTRLDYLLDHWLGNCLSTSGLVMMPTPPEKSIDIFISAIPFDQHFERFALPYVILH